VETKNNMMLYQRESCPYCQIVRKKLDLLKQPVLLVPVEESGAERLALIKVSGQQQVPVLVDGSTVVNGSGQILAYLDRRAGQTDTGPMPSNKYGLSVTVKGHYDDVIAKTTDALKSEGFGVLTEIDVKTTLKKKIDVDVPRQIILGACNPGFAHRAMLAEPDLGLLLPCNVTVRETGENEFAVSTINPVKLLAIAGREDMLPMAKEVKQKLENALSLL